MRAVLCCAGLLLLGWTTQTDGQRVNGRLPRATVADQLAGKDWVETTTRNRYRTLGNGAVVDLKTRAVVGRWRIDRGFLVVTWSKGGGTTYEQGVPGYMPRTKGGACLVPEWVVGIGERPIARTRPPREKTGTELLPLPPGVKP